MAFVFKAERNIVLSNTEHDKIKNLGPGSYIAGAALPRQGETRKPPFLTQTGRTGVAGGEQKAQPFGSQVAGKSNLLMSSTGAGPTRTGPRQVTSHSMGQKSGFTPGPGSYNVTNGFDQIKTDMQHAKTFQSFGLDQFGIQFVKPHTSFASKVKRFNGPSVTGTVAVDKEEVPGPGQYYREQGWLKQGGTNAQWTVGTKKAAALDLRNPPSIPSHDNVFGYEENAHGEYVRQKNSEKVHTGIGNDKVGPGEYDHATRQNTKGPTRWHQPEELNSKAAAIQKQKKGNQPGPGHYHPGQTTANPIYKNNIQSVFASRVPRTSLSAIVGTRTKMPPRTTPKAANTKLGAGAKSPKGIQEALESDSDSDTGPGPGQYFNVETGTFRNETKPQRLQFFGSTVERFTESQRNKQNERVGPGSYQSGLQAQSAPFSSKSIKAAPKVNEKVGFQSGQERFRDLKPVQSQNTMVPSMSAMKLETPGPGHYIDPATIPEVQTKKQYGKNATFGCTERRFAPRQGEDKIKTPGPGSYVQPSVAHGPAQEEIKRSSSMFISKTKRSMYQGMQKKARMNPGVAVVQYDDRVNTIGETMRRRVEQINNPLLASLTTKNNTTMAFSSNAPRFSQKVLDEETYVGPGYYEQKSCFERSRAGLNARSKTNMSNAQTKSVKQFGAASNSITGATASKQTTQASAGKARPSAIGGQPGTFVTPGPGHYSQPDLNRWFKRSYNMNFSEV